MTDDNIKEVINRTSIVEIINSTVPLKKKGSNYFGLSPFKKEKTPSFSVNEEKKIFHCFSTGEHGNVIDFLIKVKGYSFKDALYELADKAGIEISYKSSKLNNTIYEINLFAKRVFIPTQTSLLFVSKTLICSKVNGNFLFGEGETLILTFARSVKSPFIGPVLAQCAVTISPLSSLMSARNLLYRLIKTPSINGSNSIIRSFIKYVSS